jgi:hypothetical protein
VVYYKFLFSKCSKEIQDEMLKRAGQYVAELKGQK